MHVVDVTPQSNVLAVQTTNVQTPNKVKGKSFSKQLNKGGGAEAAGAAAVQVVTPTQSSSPSYSKPPCPVCQGDHPAYFCSAFLAKTMEQRQELVTQLHLCRNCLRSGHAAVSCRSDYRCRTCRGKHNTTLHYDTGISQALQ